MNDTPDKILTINEIFYSIQGESYLAGLPCIFIRLTGCHQRCVYCDTEYAFFEGKKQSFAEIIEAIKKYPCKNVLITGGEPLLQQNTPLLMQLLLDLGYGVAVETGGNLDISVLPADIVVVMDLKTPASGEMHRNNTENIKHLKAKDEVKFVVMNEADIDWALAQIKQHRLDQICYVSLSPTQRELHPLVAQKILASGIKIRQQMQFHKYIWPESVRGV